MKTKTWIFAGLGLLALGAVAVSQTIGVPQVQSIGPTDLFQDIVGGNPVVGNVYAPAPLLGNYAASLPGNNVDNALIGGDATTNLFQRATTGSSVTATVTYGGPDRWAYWSGTATAMTVSQDSTAADLPSGYKYAFKMARTSGQTGVLPVCMAQEIESVNSYQFAGGTAELDFHAATGATFSAASGNMTAYVVYGTGADEGMTNLAYTINSAGGGSSAWTGQTASSPTGAVVVPLGGVSTIGRYTIAVSIPSTATEMGVVLCFKPVGTAGANDYVAFSGIQLTRNSALAGIATSAGVYVGANDTRAKSFARRTQEVETAMQQRYTYAINEGTITAGAVMVGGGSAQGTTTTCTAAVVFPVTMRAAPTYTNALSATTFKLVSASQAATALSTPFSATLAANTPYNASINFTTTGMTAKDGCLLVSAAGSGQMLWAAEL